MYWLAKGLSAVWHDRKGAVAIEYSLLAALVALGLFLVVGSVGEALAELFADLAEQIP